ncbi:MAG: Holliday junction branch migration protein RuvA [Bacteroidetes bacterium]|nr:Holliday junction branch migration protein RuvA [Bacteroidota bacterium]
MINHLSGRLIEKTPTNVVIECAGVGYFVHISLFTFDKLGKEENCKLLTHLSIKEDAHTLYGFITESERTIFRQLISVSGVGANTARLILSSMDPDRIAGAIAIADVSSLKAIKGIGEKTAQRIILELKGKVSKGAEGSIFSAGHNINRDEALSALLMLGFNKAGVEKVLQKLINENPTYSVEELVKLALKNL